MGRSLVSTPLPPSASPPAAGTSACAAGVVVERTALTDVGSHVRFWVLVIVGLTLDLWSKDWAFHTLRQGGRRVLIPNVLEFQTTMNPGALFGIGHGYTEVFLVASVLALVLVVWMFVQSSRRSRLTHIALGAIMAGALGNMYDRATVQLVRAESHGPCYVKEVGAEGRTLVLTEYPPDDKVEAIVLPIEAESTISPVHGYVRDFIKIPTRWFGGRDLWPWVFNVADALLVGGVLLLALRLLLERKATVAAAASTAHDGAGGSGG